VKRLRDVVRGKIPAQVPRIIRRARRALLGKPEVEKPAVIDPNLPYGLAFDRCLRTRDGRILLVGWLFDTGGRVEQLALKTGRNEFDVLESAHRVARPDVDGVYREAWPSATPGDHGFLCFLPDTAHSDGMTAELRLADGKRIIVSVPFVEDDTAAARSLILDALVAVNSPGRETTMRELGEALAEPQVASASKYQLAGVECCGPQPESPRVSIVVPQYDRLDLLEPQFAAMAHDSSLSECELIHVIDSPWNYDRFLMSINQLSRLFQVSCKVVRLSENLGFAGATNAGANVAQGKRLLLLNSDVIPKARGWMTDMIQAYHAHDNIGALGCTLLYENDTIQHAGMAYRREELPPHHWYPYHPFKGMHAASAAPEEREVLAITGACLMVDRDLYWQVGGLSSSYLLGDFEDSDFCLRLRQLGRRNWYTPKVSLYHLEGQSYAFDPKRAAITRHNAIIHNDRWGSLLDEISPRPAF